MRKPWERYFTLFALTALSSVHAQPDGFQLVAGQVERGQGSAGGQGGWQGPAWPAVLKGHAAAGRLEGHCSMQVQAFGLAETC